MEEKKKYTVTLDDDPIFCKIIEKLTGVTSLPFRHPDKIASRARKLNPMAAFIDVHLEEGVSGLSAIPVLREVWPYTPIIVATSDQDSALVGEALSLGADDFVRKPLEKNEFMARLQARITQHDRIKEKEEFAIGDVIFKSKNGIIEKNGKITFMADTEKRLFELLVQNLGMEVPKKSILSNLWVGVSVSNNALDKQVSRLRNSLRDIDSELLIQSVYGGGVLLQLESKKIAN
ncbi:response regulator [Oligoflexaceae bacterium]|nr:response regulator [Oligoflexaceae bacterium]